MTRCHCRIEYRGRVYDSWQALADDYGLSAFCARNRIDRGIPLDLPKQKNGAWVFKPVEYGRRKYPSMHALAGRFQLSEEQAGAIASCTSCKAAKAGGWLSVFSAWRQKA